MIIDTHMHIYEKTYDDIRVDVIKGAIEANVSKMIAIGYDYESSLKAINLAEEYDFIYAAVGLHPSEVLKEKDKELSWIKRLAINKKVVAIGEIGLDYYWDKSFIDEQKKMFIKQIKISEELNLPIIIHCRDAISDCLDIVKEFKAKGVMHCFSSSLEMAREFTKRGFYLGIGGVVTFKNSKEIKRVVEGIDLEYLLSETDAPYLAPVPYRGKINKPEYLPLMIEKIAEIKCTNKEIIEESLYNNACKLFSFER